MDLEKYAISVNDINEYIKNKLDNDENLNNIVIKGELSNFKKHYTGHIYFTLKDENSLIKGVCFKSYAQKLADDLKDGDKVYVIGSVNVFARDGIYQVYAQNIQKIGMGGLHQKFLEQKAKLEKEGLFSQEHKIPIPKFPNTIAVLTSQTGSVIRDIINVATRRNPNVVIKLIPVAVQGPDAHFEIAQKIKMVNDKNLADVIIVGRGGGSLEDLWPFNEIDVAYSIYNSKIPVISAVGHETDFTIADFVADLRAPTPSAAAELAVPNILQLRDDLNKYLIRLSNGLKKKLDILELRLEKIQNSQIFKNPYRIFETKILKLEQISTSLNLNINQITQKKQTKLLEQGAKLQALSPKNTLKRGYSITQVNGKVVKSIKDIKQNEIIQTLLEDGKIISKVNDIEE